METAAAAAQPQQQAQQQLLQKPHKALLPAHDVSDDDNNDNDNDFIEVTVHYRGAPHVFRLPRRTGASSPSSSTTTSSSSSSSSPLAELSARIAATLGVAAAHQKLLVTPHVGLLKGPFGGAGSAAQGGGVDDGTGADNGTDVADAVINANGRKEKGKQQQQQQQQHTLLTLDALRSKKIVLMGPTASELASVESKPHSGPSSSSRSPYAVSAASAAAAAAASARQQQPRNNFSADSADSTTYTFTTLRPLPHLPHADRALAYLERLRADPGVRAVMRAHRWRVALLTEMDPAQHTAHDAAGGTTRILGLNRNRGEAIELRLRTDAYDGWRAYTSVRATLCHELAHNEHGEHDARFWRLCREVERHVQRADWRRGGRALTDEEFYDPEAAVAAAARHGRGGGGGGLGEGEGGEVHDHGGWIGGEYVLGGGGDGSGTGGDGGTGGGGGSGDGQAAPPVLSRREILARAAEERMKQQRQQQQQQRK